MRNGMSGIPVTHFRRDNFTNSMPLLAYDEARHRRQRDGSGIRPVLAFGRMLVVINFILQLRPAVLRQLNSNPKPLYSFILMLLSQASLLLWIIELVYRWKGETVTRRMWRGEQPLLHSPSPTNSKPFFRLAVIVGLLSTIFQSVFTTVNYALLVRHTNTHIQISGWPIILAFVLLCSTFWGDRTQIDQPDHVPLHSIIIEVPTSKYQDHFKETWWIFDLCSKITITHVFAIVNFILELPSAVLDQLCSEPKPLYALILMLLSFASILLCIIELLHKGKTERVTWRWKRIGKVPWLSPNKPFFSFWDKVRLICTVVQPILSTVNYALVLQQRGQVQISVLPIVFALAFSCSKIWESPTMTESEGNINKEEQALINQRQGVTEVSTPKKEGEATASERESGLTNQSQIRVNEEVFPKTKDGWVTIFLDQTDMFMGQPWDMFMDRPLDMFMDQTWVKYKYVRKKSTFGIGSNYGRKKSIWSDEMEWTAAAQVRKWFREPTVREPTERTAAAQVRKSFREEQMNKFWEQVKKIAAEQKKKIAAEQMWIAAAQKEGRRKFAIEKLLKNESLEKDKESLEQNKEFVFRKEKELMRAPTRRKTDTIVRRRGKSGR